MTTSPDLSPEAGERLDHLSEGLSFALAISSPKVQMDTEDAHWLISQVRAIAAENARLRTERDKQRERAEEAESEITRTQEQVSTEFEGDCWKTLRKLLDRTGFDWSEYSEDGVTADDAYQWIVDELDRLEGCNTKGMT